MVERLNQTIVTKLRCKVNKTSKKIPWPKLLQKVTEEYKLTPHSVTKFPPSYLMKGEVPFPNPLNENIYPAVEEARTLAVKRTKEYHKKNKVFVATVDPQD